jgi:hypothetical protein
VDGFSWRKNTWIRDSGGLGRSDVWNRIQESRGKWTPESGNHKELAAWNPTSGAGKLGVGSRVVKGLTTVWEANK